MVTPTATRTFGSIDTITVPVDESKPYARRVIELGVPVIEELSELETTFRGTTKRLSLRIATGVVNTLAQAANLPSPESLANQVADLTVATSRYVRSTIMILTLGDDLRFLKEKEDLHTLLGALIEARDMFLQMESDSDEMHNAIQIYKLLEKMIDRMGNVKDWGSKAIRDWTKFLLSGKKNVWRLIYGKREEEETIQSEMKESQAILSSTAPRMREILTSITEQWPHFMKTLDNLKPYLERSAEKVDIALEVK